MRRGADPIDTNLVRVAMCFLPRHEVSGLTESLIWVNIFLTPIYILAGSTLERMPMVIFCSVFTPLVFFGLIYVLSSYVNTGVDWSDKKSGGAISKLLLIVVGSALMGMSCTCVSLCLNVVPARRSLSDHLTFAMRLLSACAFVQVLPIGGSRLRLAASGVGGFFVDGQHLSSCGDGLLVLSQWGPVGAQIIVRREPGQARQPSSTFHDCVHSFPKLTSYCLCYRPLSSCRPFFFSVWTATGPACTKTKSATDTRVYVQAITNPGSGTPAPGALMPVWAVNYGYRTSLKGFAADTSMFDASVPPIVALSYALVCDLVFLHHCLRFICSFCVIALRQVL